MARFPIVAVLTAMITALVLTGHRTNPFDLEGSFTVQLNIANFAAIAFASPVTSRDFTLSVTLRDGNVPSLHFQLAREIDGMSIEQRLDCPRKSRHFATLNAQFSTPLKPEPVGRFSGSFFWDGLQGLLFGKWIVPRPVVQHELQSQLSRA